MEAKQPRSILVVDDEAGVRNALRRTLRKAGHEVIGAADAEEALRVLAERPIDLIISDQVMPSTRGVDFLGHVRARYPDTLRILLTGAADIETAQRAISEGQVFRLLTKPWDEAALCEVLAAAFSHLDLTREHRKQLEQARRTSDRLMVSF